MYKIKFAGMELSELCRIEKINRTLLPPRENFNKSIPGAHGSFYTGFKYGERVISVDIAFSYISEEDYINKLRKLSKALDVRVPSELVLSDEPNVHYYAILDGECSIEKLYKVGAKTTLTFLCNDPFAYSNFWKSFAIDQNRNFLIDNKGTAETYPYFNVDFRKKSCFLQITNNKGETVLIGNPTKVDQPTVSPTNTILIDECTATSNFTSLPESLLDSNRTVTGAYTVGLSGEGIICNNYGNVADNVWGGASFKRNIGKNLKEFQVDVHFIFSSKEITTTYDTYQVQSQGGLWINAETNNDNRLYCMPNGTKVYPVEWVGKWVKHTHKASNGKTYTGWSEADYLKKISGSDSAAAKNVDDQIGTLEIYGFSQNGEKLFKLEVADQNQFYEYAEPRAWVGNKLVLDDAMQAPDSQKSSGSYGHFNDMTGYFQIIRKKDKTGNYSWYIDCEKVQYGKTIAGMIANFYTPEGAPTGDLNYLGFYLGKNGKNNEVATMAITHIQVKEFNSISSTTNSNVQIFKRGDNLKLDFATGEVILNGVSFLEYLDIGSKFFSIPTGENELAIRTDDTSASISCGIQEKFI